MKNLCSCGIGWKWYTNEGVVFCIFLIILFFWRQLCWNIHINYFFVSPPFMYILDRYFGDNYIEIFLIISLWVHISIKCLWNFSWTEIQYGWPGLWLADIFFTSTQERLKGSTLNLVQMFLMESRPSVVTFTVDTITIMTILASDWMTLLQLLLKNRSDLLQSWHNYPYQVLTKCCYFLSEYEIQYGCHGFWFAVTFWSSSEEPLQGSTQNLAQLSYSGSDQVL